MYCSYILYAQKEVLNTGTLGKDICTLSTFENILTLSTFNAGCSAKTAKVLEVARDGLNYICEPRNRVC